MSVTLPPLTPDTRKKLLNSVEFGHLSLFEDTHSCWRLYLHEDQTYLGRAYLWYIKDHTDMQAFDTLSMFDIGKMLATIEYYRKIIQKLWNADLLNLGWYGNEFHLHRGHGHIHLIPRYAVPPVFNGREFYDMNFGKHYKPHEKIEITSKELLAIRDALRAELHQYKP